MKKLSERIEKVIKYHKENEVSEVQVRVKLIEEWIAEIKSMENGLLSLVFPKSMEVDPIPGDKFMTIQELSTEWRKDLNSKGVTIIDCDVASGEDNATTVKLTDLSMNGKVVGVCDVRSIKNQKCIELQEMLERNEICVPKRMTPEPEIFELKPLPTPQRFDDNLQKKSKLGWNRQPSRYGKRK